VQALGEALVWVLVWVRALGQAWGEGLVELVTGLEGTRKSQHHRLDNARHQDSTPEFHSVAHNKLFHLHGKAPNSSTVWAEVWAEAWAEEWEEAWGQAWAALVKGLQGTGMSQHHIVGIPRRQGNSSQRLLGRNRLSHLQDMVPILSLVLVCGARALRLTKRLTILRQTTERATTYQDASPGHYRCRIVASFKAHNPNLTRKECINKQVARMPKLIQQE